MLLHTTRCKICNKEVVSQNMIKWNGALYGKGCFSKHIKPAIMAKEIEGKEFYNTLNRTIIALIPSIQTDVSNYFVKSLKLQAQNGFLSFVQMNRFFENVTFENKVKAFGEVIETLGLANVRYIKEVADRILSHGIKTKQELYDYKEARMQYKAKHGRAKGFSEQMKAHNASKELEAMNLIKKLHNESEVFQQYIAIQHTKGGIAEFCLDLNIFRVYEEILDNTVDKLYAS